MSLPRALAAVPLLTGLLLAGCAEASGEEAADSSTVVEHGAASSSVGSAVTAVPSSSAVPAPASSATTTATATATLPAVGTKTWAVVAALGPEDGSGDESLTSTSADLVGQGHAAAVEPLRCLQGAAQALDLDAQRQAVVVFVASEDEALRFVAAHPGTGVGYAKVTVACAG